jgi:hypothetical protein
VPFGQWIEPKDLPKEITNKVLENMRVLIRMIKNDPRFRIITYSQLASELCEDGQRVIKREHIAELYNSLRERIFPVQSPMSLSLADMTLACRDFLQGKNEHICGDVYGFLDKPYEIEREITVTSKDIISACEQIKDNEFLPSKIKVGNEYVGPTDWLIGAMEVILGKETILISPKQQLPSLDCMPEVRDSDFKGTWQHSDSFEDKYLSDRLCYQSYTMRFSDKSRKI